MPDSPSDKAYSSLPMARFSPVALAIGTTIGEVVFNTGMTDTRRCSQTLLRRTAGEELSRTRQHRGQRR